MIKVGIITGASSGLGKEFALQLDKDERLDELWLIARREERLQELSRSLNKNCKILAGDLTNEHFIQNIASVLASSSVEIQTLVNSAGLGKTGSFQSVGITDNVSMIDLNITAHTKMCSVCLPYMAEKSRILNIASVAAFLPQINFAVYAATKAYVLSFSRALNQELVEKNVTVTAVCPNPVRTEFFDDSENWEKANKIKSLGMEKVEKVVAQALRKSDQKKDISISSFIAKSIQFLSRILPHPLVLKVEKWMGF